MIKGVIIKDLQKYNDERGWLMEIYRNDEVGFQPVMSYMSMTEPGVVRGPHEHKDQSDCFVFPGPGTFEVHLWDRRENSETKDEYQKIQVGEDEPRLILVPPGVVHGYKCVSDKPGLCINLPDRLYKGKDKKEIIDEIRWEEKEDTIYKII
jgi:dTDP-4-dehydrorhamnose 3,5-epimerase